MSTRLSHRPRRPRVSRAQLYRAFAAPALLVLAVALALPVAALVAVP